MTSCIYSILLCFSFLILVMNIRQVQGFARSGVREVAFRRQFSSVPFSSSSSSLSGIISSLSSPSSSSSSSSPSSSSESDGKKKPRVLSGVQPTGSLHLGNYHGAIRQWVDYQNEFDNYFCIVDLHAITVQHDPTKLRQETLNAAAMCLAAGIDPSRSRLFVQSQVPAHAEMAWLLNCVTPMGWLERMIQFKEKSRNQGEGSGVGVGLGLFSYPVLMAADILLYQTELVPVGEDQRQHLELARDIARRFNDQYCKKKNSKGKSEQVKVMREPRALIARGGEGSRVMSLTDGTSKMSKSAESDFSRINLLDTPETIALKIKRCKTDSFPGLEWDNPSRPECANLLSMYQAAAGVSREEAGRHVEGLKWGQFKPLLTDALVAHLGPIQARYGQVVADPAYLRGVLREGADAAGEEAGRTLGRTKEAMGFL